LPFLIDGQVQRGAVRLGGSVDEAAYELGNGAQVTAQDTVPFAVWAAATFLYDYPAALTACVQAGGDVDTMGAIVGGIVAAYPESASTAVSVASHPTGFTNANRSRPGRTASSTHTMRPGSSDGRPHPGGRADSSEC